MFLPSYYDDPVNEYWHLLNEVTLWDVSVERNTEITGPDAFRFTSLLTPRDVRKCRVGQGKYVLIKPRTIREPDVSPLQIQGPKSKQVVVTRTGWTSEVG